MRPSLTLPLLLLATSLGACARGDVAPATGAKPPASCDYASTASKAGKTWWSQQRWRYASDAEAEAAYKAIAVGQSPWPDWFAPVPETTLAPGTRFQMAMAPNQADDAPGGWGTFDAIATVKDVREFLAVTPEFKPAVNRVITYEVTRSMQVKIGPVGPQVNRQNCTWLPGRWSQFNMLAPWNERMSYLKVIAVRPIR